MVRLTNIQQSQSFSTNLSSFQKLKHLTIPFLTTTLLLSAAATTIVSPLSVLQQQPVTSPPTTTWLLCKCTTPTPTKNYIAELTAWYTQYLSYLQGSNCRKPQLYGRYSGCATQNCTTFFAEMLVDQPQAMICGYAAAMVGEAAGCARMGGMAKCWANDTDQVIIAVFEYRIPHLDLDLGLGLVDEVRVGREEEEIQKA